MANRFFNQWRFSLEKQVVDLFARITFGASGAPTLDAANSKGIKSVARTAAGKYTITLQDNYYRLLGVKSQFLLASGLPASPVAAIMADSVSSGSFSICFSTGGTATDPASGEEVRIAISLKNSSV